MTCNRTDFMTAFRTREHEALVLPYRSRLWGYCFRLVVCTPATRTVWTDKIVVGLDRRTVERYAASVLRRVAREA